MPSRAREPLWLLGLALLVGLHVAAGLRWVALDARPDEGVCCELVPRLQQSVEAVAAGQWRLRWQPTDGWTPLLALPWLGRSADATLYSALAALSLLQVGAAVAARLLAGPAAGLLAAAYLPLVPLLALTGRRFDVTAPQLALVTLALVLLLASRGLSRLLPTLGLALTCVALAFSSPLPTDNLLALFAVGSATAGAWLRALAAGRDAWGRPLDRRAALAGGLLLLATVGTAIISGPAGDDSRPGGAWAYYTAELTAGEYRARRAWHDPVELFGYAGHLYWRGLTAWHGLPLLLGLPLYLWLGRARAELLGLVLGPLLLLSPIPKKNYYYAAATWPGLALLTVLGVAALPGRWPRRLAAAALLLTALAQWGARSFPDAVAGTPLEGRYALPYDPGWGGVLQTLDGELELGPRPAGPGQALGAVLDGLVDAPPCTCRYTVLAVPPMPSASEWWLHQVVADPCLPLETWDLPLVKPRTGVVLLPIPDPTAGPRDLGQVEQARREAEAALRLVERVPAGNTAIEVWARDGAWLEAACRPAG